MKKFLCALALSICTMQLRAELEGEREFKEEPSPLREQRPMGTERTTRYPRTGVYSNNPLLTGLNDPSTHAQAMEELKKKITQEFVDKSWSLVDAHKGAFLAALTRDTSTPSFLQQLITNPQVDLQDPDVLKYLSLLYANKIGRQEVVLPVSPDKPLEVVLPVSPDKPLSEEQTFSTGLINAALTREGNIAENLKAIQSIEGYNFDATYALNRAVALDIVDGTVITLLKEAGATFDITTYLTSENVNLTVLLALSKALLIPWATLTNDTLLTLGQQAITSHNAPFLYELLTKFPAEKQEDLISNFSALGEQFESFLKKSPNNLKRLIEKFLPSIKLKELLTSRRQESSLGVADYEQIFSYLTSGAHIPPQFINDYWIPNFIDHIILTRKHLDLTTIFSFLEKAGIPLRPIAIAYFHYLNIFDPSTIPTNIHWFLTQDPSMAFELLSILSKEQEFIVSWGDQQGYMAWQQKGATITTLLLPKITKQSIVPDDTPRIIKQLIISPANLQAAEAAGFPLSELINSYDHGKNTKPAAYQWMIDRSIATKCNTCLDAIARYIIEDSYAYEDLTLSPIFLTSLWKAQKNKNLWLVNFITAYTEKASPEVILWMIDKANKTRNLPELALLFSLYPLTPDQATTLLKEHSHLLSNAGPQIRIDTTYANTLLEKAVNANNYDDIQKLIQVGAQATPEMLFRFMQEKDPFEVNRITAILQLAKSANVDLGSHSNLVTEAIVQQKGEALRMLLKDGAYLYDIQKFDLDDLQFYLNARPLDITPARILNKTDANGMNLLTSALIRSTNPSADSIIKFMLENGADITRVNFTKITSPQAKAFVQKQLDVIALQQVSTLQALRLTGKKAAWLSRFWDGLISLFKTPQEKLVYQMQQLTTLAKPLVVGTIQQDTLRILTEVETYRALGYPQEKLPTALTSSFKELSQALTQQKVPVS